MDIFENKPLKIVGIAATALYTVFLAWMAYASFFYRVTYTNRPVFTFLYVALSLILLLFMFFSKKSRITQILSLTMLIFVLPIFILNFGDWLLIIPPAIVALTMFFANESSEKVKTILGTLYLLMYIVVALMFFIYINVLSPKTVKNVMEEAISPNQSYRYIVYDVKDHGSGKTEVYVEPADKDIDLKVVLLQSKGIDKCVYRARDHKKPIVEWKNEDTLFINGKEYSYELEPWDILKVI